MLTRIAFASKRYWGYTDDWIESWREILTVKSAFIKDHEVYMASREGAALAPAGLENAAMRNAIASSSKTAAMATCPNMTIQCSLVWYWMDSPGMRCFST